MVEVAKRDIPVRDFAGGDEQAKEDGNTGDGRRPGEVRRDFADQFAQDLRLPGARGARIAVRQQSRHPYRDRRRSEDGDEQQHLGDKDRPEDVDVADGGKPQPVNQHAGEAADDDQADDANRNPGGNAPQVRAGYPWRAHRSCSFAGPSSVACCSAKRGRRAWIRVAPARIINCRWGISRQHAHRHAKARRRPPAAKSMKHHGGRGEIYGLFMPG